MGKMNCSGSHNIGGSEWKKRNQSCLVPLGEIGLGERWSPPPVVIFLKWILESFFPLGKSLTPIKGVG